MQVDRRSFVKATGAGAVLATTGLAGCNGFLGGGGAGGSARSWQYDPSTLAETETRFFGSMDYAGMYQSRDSLPESMQESFAPTEDAPIDPADVDLLTGVGGAQMSQQGDSGAFYGSAALTGSFDGEALASEVESEGDAQQTGEYEGYTLYETSDMGETGFGMSQLQGSGTAAVGDTAVVVGVSVAQNTDVSVTGEDAVRASIDASNGNAALLHDNSQHATQLSSQLGDATMVVGGEVDPALVDAAGQDESDMAGQVTSGIRAGGFGVDIDGDTTTFTFVGIYESAQRAEDSGVVGLAEGFSAQFEQQEGVNSIDANQDGSAVVVTVTGDTETIFEAGESQATGQTFDLAPAPF